MSAPHYGYTGDDDPAKRDLPTFEHPCHACNSAAEDGSEPVLSVEQIKQWHSERFLVIDGVWPTELIQAAGAELEALYPTPSASHSAEELREAGPTHDPGGFPWGPHLGSANLIPTHPRALRAVAQLLGTEEIMLTQSGAGAKYGAGGHELPRLSGSSAGFGQVGDQPIHKD
jgi:hypothetical protein